MSKKLLGYLFKLNHGAYYLAPDEGVTYIRSDAYLYSPTEMHHNININGWGRMAAGEWQAVYG